jgi:hypothetical protein
MKPKLPLNLDHSCWRNHGIAYEDSPSGRYPVRGADPDETKCPACQWLAGYEAAMNEKGDSG